MLTSCDLIRRTSGPNLPQPRWIRFLLLLLLGTLRVNNTAPHHHAGFTTITDNYHSACLLMHHHRFVNVCLICLGRGSCLLWLFLVSVPSTLRTIHWCFECEVWEDDTVVSFPSTLILLFSSRLLLLYFTFTYLSASSCPMQILRCWHYSIPRMRNSDICISHL